MNGVSPASVRAVLDEVRLSKAKAATRTAKAGQRQQASESDRASPQKGADLKQQILAKIEDWDRSDPQFAERVTVLVVHEMIVREYTDAIIDDVSIDHVVAKTINSMKSHPKLRRDLNAMLAELSGH